MCWTDHPVYVGKAHLGSASARNRSFPTNGSHFAPGKIQSHPEQAIPLKLSIESPKMRPIIAITLSCAALSGAPVLTADEKKIESSDRILVTKFLKDHVMHKTVTSPKTTYKLDDNKMETDSEEQTTFNNFTDSEQGFSFDIAIVSKETRYELNKDGKRVQPGRDLSGIEVYRYEIVERVSTKKLTGTVILVSMTTKAPSRGGAAILVMGMIVSGGKLTWNETLPGYLDLIASGGKYKPGSWDSKNTVSLNKGKLRIEYDITNFDVDPETLKRTPMKENLPLFVATEVE
jgi:hypothetical protein